MPGPSASHLALTDSVPGRILNGNLTLFANSGERRPTLLFLAGVGMLVGRRVLVGGFVARPATEGGIVGPDRPPSAQPPRAPLPFRTANRLVRRPRSFKP